MSIFVAFNKIDLLDIKLKNFSSFTDVFMNYDREHTREGALLHFEKMFKDEIPLVYEEKYFSFFPICALERDVLHKMFEEAKAQLLDRMVGVSGMAL